MDRGRLLTDLEMAQRHVVQGEGHIVSQKRIIAELGRDGHDTTAAMKLLTIFEELQLQNESRLKRIQNQLEALDPRA
jgi:hypothetical protein